MPYLSLLFLALSTSCISLEASLGPNGDPPAYDDGDQGGGGDQGDGEAQVVIEDVRGFDSVQGASFHVARRKLDAPFWRTEGLEELTTLGLDYHMIDPDSGFGFEVACYVAGTDQDVDVRESGAGTLGGAGSDLELGMAEFSVGARFVFDADEDDWGGPFVGAGISLVRFDVDDVADDVSDEIIDGDGVGFYYQGGLQFRVARHVNFGLLYRVLTSTDLNSFDLDYEQFGMFVGGSF